MLEKDFLSRTASRTAFKRNLDLWVLSKRGLIKERLAALSEAQRTLTMARFRLAFLWVGLMVMRFRNEKAKPRPGSRECCPLPAMSEVVGDA